VWEIAAVPRDLRDVFSKRHQQVRQAETAAAEGGTVTTEQRKLIAAQTARAKDPAATVTDLRRAWALQAAEAGYDMAAVAQAATARYGPEPETSVEAIAQRIWDVQNGLCAHKKTVSHAEVLAAVANAAHTIADLAELERLADAVLAVPGYAVRLDADLPGTLTAPQRYTQADIVEAEQAILTAARERRHAGAAVVDHELVAGAIEAFELANGFTLSAEQRAVVERLTGAGHGLDAVIGVAGSGKTTIMEALLLAHRSAGHVVAGASTAAIAAHHLEAETRIPSMTIASWLGRIERGPGLAGVDVLIIDEAGMVDDRQLARLVAAAAASGTQLIGIGDPLQLRAPGVGSTFADVHGAVEGLRLADNRRQQHETEIRALAAWREGDRRALLDAFDERGALHVEEQLDGVWEAMVGTWWADVRRIADPHERIAARLLIVGTNADVAIVNHGAQAIRLAEGELDPAAGRDYRVEGGQVLRLHVGDVVAARHNDYDTGVLNGYRGVVEAIEADGTVHVAVRETGSAEPVIKHVSEQYVRTGHLELGYAMTGHRSQGRQAQKTLVSLTGMDAHAAYSAATRHRERADVWLAAAVLEDDATRARLGEPATDRERLERTVDAYLDFLARPEPDPLVLAGLAGARGDLLDHRDSQAPVQAAFPESVPQAPQWVDEEAESASEQVALSTEDPTPELRP
jgi:ATP-dependent exoDNAse (exonuclease V) alpha subunit